MSAHENSKAEQGDHITMQPSTTNNQEGEMKEIEVQNADPALQYLGGEAIEYTADEARSVLRKIDWTLMPMLCWVYALQFADKTSLNYASLMGIREDTHLNPQSQEFSWASSIFYAGYIFWEFVIPSLCLCLYISIDLLYRFPTTYLLRRLPLGKYSSANIALWGIVLTCHCAASSYAGLMTVRFFLGAFEATVTPAFVILTSVW
jgi:MFS transporter, ACS family, allantoate permease